ncbi:hypothetical protein [Streptococcus thoraltensis]|uniref:hypothetical protein n=1 Tax=Streptococcus thoraltensis TaxID=55085 RepID=UPI001F596769|nr:hypothetical protein [Streptococcus thoraltensis]
MRVYINKRNKLTIAPDIYEKWGATATDTIQIKDSSFIEDIKRDIDQHIENVIGRYEAKIEDVDLTPFFEEKQRQIKQSFDFSTALTEVIEG